MLKLFNIFLRLCNVFLKVLLTFIIAKILSITELGTFGIILAFFTLFVYLIGWEIWYIYNRELTKYYQVNLKKTIYVLQNQFISYIFLYIIIFPPLTLYLISKYPNYWSYMIIIIISLHVSQEISRIYTHINKHLLASFTTLSVQSFWVLMIVYLYTFSEKKIDLEYLLQINAYISIIFLALAIFIFIKILNIKNRYIYFSFKILKIKNIFLTIFKTTKFLVSVSFFLLGILIGRFILDNFGFSETVGIYSYFQNIASVSLIILNFGLTVINIPKLIKNKINLKEHNSLLKDFFKKTIIYSLLIYIAISFLAYIYLFLILKDNIFIENYNIFLVINIGYFILNLNSYYNSILYVWQKDKEVVLSNIYSFIISLPLFSLLFIIEKPLEVVTMAFILWGTFNLTFKRKYAKRILNDINYR